MGVNLESPPLLDCVECGRQTGGRVQCIQCNGHVSICTICLGTLSHSKINWEMVNSIKSGLTCHQSLCKGCNRDKTISEIINI